MTQYLNPRILDYGLTNLVLGTTRLLALSSAPTDYDSLAAKTLGVKDSPVLSGPATSGGGRKVTVAAVTDGTITVDGTATHWALADDKLPGILAWGQFAAPKAFTTADDFATGAFDIILPGLNP